MAISADRKLAKQSLASQQREMGHRRHGVAQCEKPSGRASSARKASPPHMIRKRTAKLAPTWRTVRTLVCARVLMLPAGGRLHGRTARPIRSSCEPPKAKTAIYAYSLRHHSMTKKKSFLH